MKKNYFLILLISAISVQNFAQDSEYLDSLYYVSAEHYVNYQYKESIEVALFLLEEAQNQNDGYFLNQAHTILGTSYGDLNDTIRAEEHYYEALKFAKEIENDTLILWAYNNLGNVYSVGEKNYQKGIDYYEKVIEMANTTNNLSEIFVPTLNIAWTYIDKEKYEKAWPYLERSWELYETEEKDIITDTELNTLTARYYSGVGNLEQAEPYFDKAITLVEQDSLVVKAAEVYESYAKYLFKKGDYEAAYLALETFNEYKAQIFRKERLKQIEAASIQFDVAKYQKDLEIANKERLLKDEVIEKSREKMLVMAFSSIILIIILVVLVKTSRSRRRLISEMSNKNEELMEAKEEAERLSLLKTKFFSTISHELRTPLYGVIGLTSILLEDKSLSKHETDLKSLKFSADYLLALINDVLQVNKMESNLVKLEKLPFNLKILMRSIVKTFEFTRLQNKNNIHLNLDPATPKNLLGDTVRLSQILMNLVGNAMKFTERGNIWISSRVVENKKDSVKIYFEVKDDGMGIPLNKQSIIFEEFSQLKASNYNYQGTGLGLPIVRRLLTLFGSEIKLESEEDIGSTFSFEIEFEKNEKANLKDTPHSHKEHVGLTEAEAVGKQILIVDDNRINQVVTKRILEKKGFICSISDNGTDAVEMVKINYYDLILMDVNMPGITGLEATTRIREFNKNVPIIALTAVEIEEIREEILEAGMNDIIVKPYDTSVFYQVIFRNIPSEVMDNPTV